MESKTIYSRGSATVLGNTPFQESLATASALHETDERVNELSDIVYGLRSLSREWEDKFLMKGTVSAITGNYATHKEVLDSATATSANAYGILHGEITTVSARLDDEMRSKASMNDLTTVSGDLKAFYDEMRAVSLPSSVSSLETKITNEENARMQNDASTVRLIGITSGTLQDRVNTVSGNVVLVNSNLNAKILELSATDKQRMDGIDQRITNHINDAEKWIDDGVIDTFAESNENPPRFQVGNTDKNSDLWIYGDTHATKAMTVNGDFESKGRFNTSAIEDSMYGVKFKKPISVLGQLNDIEIGNGCISLSDIYQMGDYNYVGAASIAAGGENRSTFGSIAIGIGCSASNRSISVGSYCKSSSNGAAFGNGVTAGSMSFAFNATNDDYVTPNRTFSVYVPKYISGVYINGNSLYQIFRDYTVTNEEADQKIETAVEQNVSRTSGTIVSSAAGIVSGAYLPSLKSELMTQIDDEHDSRILDVSSVRAELPNYIPLSGGVVYGDLEVKDIDIMSVYSGSHDIQFDVTKDASRIDVHTVDMELHVDNVMYSIPYSVSAASATLLQSIWDGTADNHGNGKFIISEQVNDDVQSYAAECAIWDAASDGVDGFDENNPGVEFTDDDAGVYMSQGIRGVTDGGINWYDGPSGIASALLPYVAEYATHDSGEIPSFVSNLSHYNDYQLTAIPASSLVQPSDFRPPRCSNTSLVQSSAPVIYKSIIKYDEYVPSSVTAHKTETVESVTLCHPISVLEKLAHENCLPDTLNIRCDFYADGTRVSRKADFTRSQSTAYKYNTRDFETEANHVSTDIKMLYSAYNVKDAYGMSQDLTLLLSATSSMENGIPVYRYVDSIRLSGHFNPDSTESISTTDWECILPLDHNKTVNMYVDEQDELMDSLRDTSVKIDSINSALSATKNTLSYESPSVSNGSYPLSPDIAVYKVEATMDGTSATIPDADDSAIPTGNRYYCFEVEATIPDTATTLIGPSDWVWLEDGELPEYQGDFQGKTIHISCRLDCAVNNREVLANVWRIR